MLNDALRAILIEGQTLVSQAWEILGLSALGGRELPSLDQVVPMDLS